MPTILWAANPEMAVRPFQGWPTAGYRVVEYGGPEAYGVGCPRGRKMAAGHPPLVVATAKTAVSVGHGGP
jgi:hypothetical protein